MKTIDLSQSVYALCSKYPELIGIMAQIGFADIAKPSMLQTAGRLMTIPKGAALKKRDMDMIKEKLEAHGYKAI